MVVWLIVCICWISLGLGLLFGGGGFFLCMRGMAVLENEFEKEQQTKRYKRNAPIEAQLQKKVPHLQEEQDCEK